MVLFGASESHLNFRTSLHILLTAVISFQFIHLGQRSTISLIMLVAGVPFEESARKF